MTTKTSSSKGKPRKVAVEQKYDITVFQKWASPRNDGSKAFIDSETGLRILHVNTWESLIQAVDYVRFREGSKKSIYLRGQNKLYFDDSVPVNDKNGYFLFVPYALRGKGIAVPTKRLLAKHQKTIACQVAEIRASNPKSFGDPVKFPDAVLQGLIQQYGGRTTWLDAVDNIWIALWFACYTLSKPVEVTTDAHGLKRQCFHMTKRIPEIEDVNSRYAYIILLGGERDGDMEVVDLRISLPSDFVRPHAQHGVLIRTKPVELNMVRLIQGIIRIDLENALEWLGNGSSFTQSGMIPPPQLDSGFAQLLRNEDKMQLSGRIAFPIYC